MYLLCKINFIENEEIGFSLIEMISVLVLLGLLGVYFLGGYMNSVRSHVNADENYQQVQKSQAALLRIVLEMQNSTAISVVGNEISYTYIPTGIVRKISLADGVLSLFTNATDPNTKHPISDNVSGFSPVYASKILSFTLTTTFSNDSTKDFITSVYIP